MQTDILFAILFASFWKRSSLIRVYTVCHSVCIFWIKKQSDQGRLRCLPFRLHLLDEGAVWSGIVCNSINIFWLKEQSDHGLHCLLIRLHLLDEGAVWSQSTLFANSFASFGRRSSLIKVYTVCHSICIFWMKEQSGQGLYCLPFRLHLLDEGAVWSASTQCHSACIL